MGYTGEGDVHMQKLGAILQKCLNTFVPHYSFKILLNFSVLLRNDTYKNIRLVLKVMS